MLTKWLNQYASNMKYALKTYCDFGKVIMKSPLYVADAKLLLKKILNNGVVTYSHPHALERLKERALSMLDCENVLQGGKIEADGMHRFKVSTTKITIVIEFLSEEEVLVVTAWR